MTKTLSHHHTLRTPSYLVEYAFYGLQFYLMLGEVLGLSIPLLGAGVLVVLVTFSFMHAGARVMGLIRPIAPALLCALSTIVLQLVIHEETIAHSEMRSYVTWAWSLVVVQMLLLRPQFFHRFAWVSFFLACGTLPFIKVYVSTGELTRIGATSGVGLANPNAFAMWFGFCYVYFLVLGLETKNYLVRVAAWSAAIFSIYFVAATVSRGPLLGIVIASAFAFKNVLKRSFLPIISFLVCLWCIYVSGIADELIGYYLERGTEESGRTYLWSVALESMWESWWVGVGISDAVITLPSSGYKTNPHNGFLFIGLASGIIPLLFFITYLARVIRGALVSSHSRNQYAAFVFPLTVFALLEVMIIGQAFMSIWHIVVFSIAISCCTNFSRRRVL
ncbi:MAG: hypothetical protein NPIRA04_16100 [Nitrospirales bacterium]|nr:MAG: hypothetical protein NPIRA04_16100 [Nitrospirales bacterium]